MSRPIVLSVLLAVLSGACGSDTDAGTGECVTDAECDNNLFCDGEETCSADAESVFRCTPGTPVTCDDAIACTSDACSESEGACVYNAPDEDGDGHGDRECVDGSGMPLGDDCDDSDDASTTTTTDGDCDGILAADDCDDDDSGSTIVATDADCDGILDPQDAAFCSSLGSSDSFDGPVPTLYWDFAGGAANDVTLPASDGTLGGTVAPAVGFLGGEAMAFDGAQGTRITSGSIEKSDVYTVAAWINLAAYTPARGVILDLGNGPGAWEGIGLQMREDGTLGAWVESGVPAEERGTPSSTVLPLNTWSHVAATFDGGTLRAYQDGIEVGSVAVPFTDINFGSNNFVVGVHTYFNDFEFNGLIDEVAYWTTPLSADDISNLVEAQCNGAALASQ